MIPDAACYRHGRASSTSACASCGRRLCAYCTRCFEPPACVPCVLASTSRRRWLLRVRLFLFPLLLAFTYAVVNSLLWPHWGPHAAGPALAVGWWTASLPSGWRVVSGIGGRLHLVVRLPLAVLLAGPAAPYGLCRTLVDLRDVRMRSWMARSLL